MPPADYLAQARAFSEIGELLRQQIAHTVSRPEEVDEEIRALFATLQQ